MVKTTFFFHSGVDIINGLAQKVGIGCEPVYEINQTLANNSTWCRYSKISWKQGRTEGGAPGALAPGAEMRGRKFGFLI